MTVKPPTGMQEELARPVIEVVEFPSGKITHEMFAFGSEIAVVPVEGRRQPFAAQITCPRSTDSHYPAMGWCTMPSPIQRRNQCDNLRSSKYDFYPHW